MRRPDNVIWSFARLMLMLAGIPVGSSHASPATFHPLATNGPAANRVSVVFLSEGYTAAESGTFLTDCTNAMNAILNEEPFTEYASLFHFYAIFTNSVESGSDHPFTGTFRNTCFNSTYDAVLDYVITIPAANWSNGVLPLLTAHVPTNTHRFRLPVLLVNDITQGGSASTNLAISSTSPAAFTGILAHELAHLFALLDDEYESAGGLDVIGLPAGPNTTQQTNRALIPWTAWISPNTPVPTDPEDPEAYDAVGLFEGAHYTTTNWYRPQLNCRMRSVASGIAFCAVCREALVRTAYVHLRTYDAATPTNAVVSVSSAGEVNFTITPLQPATHSLSLQWQTNGVNVPDATNTTFTLATGALPDGNHTLRVIVRDETDWVRTDPSPLAGTNVWTLSVALPSLWLEAPQALAGGGFRLTVRGTNVSLVTVQGSANFTQWTGVATNSLAGGVWNFTNHPGAPGRFYRAVTPPQ